MEIVYEIDHTSYGWWIGRFDRQNPDFYQCVRYLHNDGTWQKNALNPKLNNVRGHHEMNPRNYPAYFSDPKELIKLFRTVCPGETLIVRN